MLFIVEHGYKFEAGRNDAQERKYFLEIEPAKKYYESVADLSDYSFVEVWLAYPKTSKHVGMFRFSSAWNDNRNGGYVTVSEFPAIP